MHFQCKTLPWFDASEFVSEQLGREVLVQGQSNAGRHPFQGSGERTGRLSK